VWILFREFGHDLVKELGLYLIVGVTDDRNGRIYFVEFLQVAFDVRVLEIVVEEASGDIGIAVAFLLKGVVLAEAW
jgi:hypothetical protein